MRNTKYIALFCMTVMLVSHNLFGRTATNISWSSYKFSREQQILSSAQDDADKPHGDENQDDTVKQLSQSTGTDETPQKSRKKRLGEIAKDNALADIEEINRKMTAPQKYLNKYPEYVGKRKSGIFRLFSSKTAVRTIP